MSHRATLALRALGISAIVSVAFTVWLGLWVTPPDKVMHNFVRLVYVHPPIAWVALYLAFGTAGISSALWLWPRTRSIFFDRLAVSAMETGTVFTALTLVTGSIWGRTTWGVWWAWDARLTSTALLLVLQLGYLTLRRVPADPDARARRSAVAALVIAVDIPIVIFSVEWWHTLHQGATVLNSNLSPTIHGAMAWTLLLGFVAFTLVFLWMLVTRYRVQVLADTVEGRDLDLALHERWTEGGLSRGRGSDGYDDVVAGYRDPDSQVLVGSVSPASPPSPATTAMPTSTSTTALPNSTSTTALPPSPALPGSTALPTNGGGR